MLLGLALTFAGISHLTFARQEFVAQVPAWLPLEQDFVVVVSGVIEIVLGICLVFVSRYRQQIGLITAIFFVAVFPGNIAQFTEHRDAFGLNTDGARTVRLFFQPLLVAWAFWGTSAFTYLKNTLRRKDK